MLEFADLTIHRKLPSHLLCKIYWIGNEGYMGNRYNNVIDKIAILIEKKGITAKGKRPTQAEACKCASVINKAMSNIFHKLLKDKILDYVYPDALDKILRNKLGSLFRSAKPVGMSCKIVLSNDLRSGIQATLINYFHYIVLYG